MRHTEKSRTQEDTEKHRQTQVDIGIYEEI